MVKKSKTPKSKNKKRKREVVEEETEEVDILAEAPAGDEAGSSKEDKRKERKDKGQPRMKVAALKMKNKERFVLVNAGWKKLDPKEVIIFVTSCMLNVVCLGWATCCCLI